MGFLMRLRQAWEPRVLSILRIIVGLLFLEHGTQKIFDFPPRPNARPFELFTLVPGLAGIMELVGGILIVLGLFTRPVAIVSTLLMVAFVIGISQAWARGLTIDCGCFGGGGEIGAADTKYPQEIARDVVFALAGVWLWWRPRSLASLDRILFGH